MLASVESVLDTLFDFALPEDAAAWQAIGDPVMGGASVGRLLPLPGGSAAFSGDLSLAGGGGFASVRSAPGRFDLSHHEAIVLEARGDGRLYTIALRTDPYFDGVSYQASFSTRPGRWDVVRIPFASFHPRWRGRPVPGAPGLEPGRVVSLGIVLADRRAGPFHLEIQSIRALRRGRGPGRP